MFTELLPVFPSLSNCTLLTTMKTEFETSDMHFRKPFVLQSMSAVIQSYLRTAAVKSCSIKN